MRLLRKKKVIIPAIVGVLALVGAGVAYGFFTSSGSGTGNAYVGTAASVAINQLTPKTQVLYDSIVSPQPQDMFSEAFNATGTTEFGNEVNLASPGQELDSVQVTMSDWACQTGSGTTCVTTPGATFPLSMTLTIYSVGADNSVGSIIASDTQTMNIPYRPSSNNSECLGPNLDNPNAGPGAANGEWYNGSTCSIDLNSNITFNGVDFTVPNITLPGSVIYGISYDATSGPAQSLNVAVSDDTGNVATTNVTVGSDAIAGDFLDSSEAVSYCNNAPADGTGYFQYDPYTPSCTGGNAVDNPAPDGSPATLNYPTGFWVPAVQFNGIESSAAFIDLFPAGPGEPVDFSITNSSNSPVYVQSVTYSITSMANVTDGNGPGDCNPAWFSQIQPSVPIDVTIPANTTIDYQPSGGVIALMNEPFSQDGCEGAVLGLTFAST